MTSPAKLCIINASVPYVPQQSGHACWQSRLAS